MSSLDEARARLEELGSPLILSARTAGLPAPLAEFLDSVPGRTLTVVPEAGGITRSGRTLTVAGGTSDVWPVDHTAYAIRLSRAELTLTETDGEGGATVLTVTGKAVGLLDFGAAQPLAATVTSTRRQNPEGVLLGWQLHPASTTDFDVRTLLTFGTSGAAAAGLPVPAAVRGTCRIEPPDFALDFHPGSLHKPRLAVTARLPALRWAPAGDVLAFEGVTVQAAVGPGGYRIALIGDLVIGGVPIEATVHLAPGSRRTVTLRPRDAVAFPGVAALAGWLAGPDRGSAAAAALAGLRGQAPGPDPAGLDAAIAKVTVQFDPAAGRVLSVQVVSLLTLGALRLDVQVTLPDLRIDGRLHDGGDPPPHAKVLLDSLGLPSAGLPERLAIAEAVFSAEPYAGRYRAALALNDVWQIGPVTLTELSVRLAHGKRQGLTGSLGARLDFGASIAVLLSAEYAGETAGWRFAGATVPGAEPALGDFLAALARDFGVGEVPALLESLSLSDVAASFETGSGDFTFSCTGDFALAGAPARLRVDIELHRRSAQSEPAGHTGNEPGGYAAAFRAALLIRELAFEMALGVHDGIADARIEAHWAAEPDQSALTLASLAAGLGLPIPTVPDGLDLGLSGADLSYDTSTGRLMIAGRSTSHDTAVFVALPSEPAAPNAPDGHGSTAPQYLAALTIGRSIDLSDLPLVGSALGPDETCAVQDLRVVLSSGPISPQTAATANSLLPAGAAGFPQPVFPRQGTAGPLAVAAVLRFGRQTIPVALGTAADEADPGGAVVPGSAVTPGGAPHSAATVGTSEGPGSATAAPPDDEGTVWFTVQRAFGPLTLDRVGARYADGALQFALDGALSAAGLSLALQGAAVAVPLSDFVPRYTLRGLALAYASPPLAILGGFTAVPPAAGAAFRYDGAAAVSLKDFGALAYGSYTEVEGQPSMFLFLRAAGAFGGPPAFSVTALAAGFGYNSSIRLPAVHEVADFPFVAGLADPTRLGGPDASPAAALAALAGGDRPWLTPAPGQNWLAAGVRFTTFRQLDTTALLAAEFGNTLTVLLLGVSTGRFPAGAARPYAQLQLELRAVLRPGEGVFELAGALTRESFLIDPACVLTGGFAFSCWFGEHRHAGDFAVTVGGYHPAFDPPEHYPVVPRAGFSWSLDAAVRITGTAYFALTPSAIMAGGSLDVPTTTATSPPGSPPRRTC